MDARELKKTNNRADLMGILFCLSSIGTLIATLELGVLAALIGFPVMLLSGWFYGRLSTRVWREIRHRLSA